MKAFVFKYRIPADHNNKFNNGGKISIHGTLKQRKIGCQYQLRLSQFWGRCATALTIFFFLLRGRINMVVSDRHENVLNELGRSLLRAILRSVTRRPAFSMLCTFYAFISHDMSIK
ncbi:hypothetical protein D917_08210 [Trichinella nativa]|uniref:Uncharacterized protein n=1 Tax=Trichinella nativa TaxID=6335 RepID=A0A1Y3EKY0_9BILA|nr:hypothetical protein D917_08210 [Trichinella nativa]